jgi:hypothetical protein
MTLRCGGLANTALAINTQSKSFILKNRHGLGPPVRGRNSLCYCCKMEGSGRSLIGGPTFVGNPVKKRGSWVDANLRVVTPSLR